jgi:pimeloyl-ACP methyl ester carboxylesterase
MIFMDVVNGERLGHTSLRGGVYWEDMTYSDRRSLLYIPRGFDFQRPAAIIVFLHGNFANLGHVRDRQQVPRQVAESGLNAVLVAPQLARDAADSSSGRFWEPGLFAKYLNEAVDKLTQLHGDPRSRATFEQAPVILAAYSGGYQPVAFGLAVGGIARRVRGVILLDALFAEFDKFADWVAGHPQAFLFSAYGKAARSEHAELQRLLEERQVKFQTTVPARLTPGSVALFAVGDDVKHNDFVTQSWVQDPLRFMLAKVPGFPRTGSSTASPKTAPEKKR